MGFCDTETFSSSPIKKTWDRRTTMFVYLQHNPSQVKICKHLLSDQLCVVIQWEQKRGTVFKWTFPPFCCFPNYNWHFASQGTLISPALPCCFIQDWHCFPYIWWHFFLTRVKDAGKCVCDMSFPHCKVYLAQNSLQRTSLWSSGDFVRIFFPSSSTCEPWQR